MKVAVLGAGAWGTALAEVAGRAGNEVRLWARDPAIAADIATRHENCRRLPGVALDPAIGATGDLAAAIDEAGILVVAVPTQAVRQLGDALAGLLPRPGRNGPAVVVTAKGIERASGLFPADILAATLPGRPVAVLSGPSFADDVARGLPTAVTLACSDAALAGRLAGALGHAGFRPYASDDLVGTQLGGAAKNVLAIACGIVEGRALGASAAAALIARGFAEMNRLGRALGARPETLAGLSGLGDLVLSATSAQSRNFAFGVALGRGERDATPAPGGAVTEGVWTAPALVARARAAGVDLPICAAVDDVLSGRLDIDAAIAGLLARPLRREA